MSSGGTHRSPSPEKENPARSIKKVKTTEIKVTNDVEDTLMDQEIEDAESPKLTNSIEEKACSPKLSYKEKLIAGECPESSFSPQEIIDLVSEELIVGDFDKGKQVEEKRVFDPSPVVPISLEEYEEWCRPWKFSLVIKLLGKKIGFKWMNQRIHQLWAREGDMKVMDLADDYFLVRFGSEKDYVHALFEGPWMIADHYLLVQRWRPMFKAEDSEVKKIAVWIQLPKLPVELYKEKFLWRLGSLLGTMLKIDTHTTVHSRGKFARICVEIDLSQKLSPTVTALGTECKLEYEGLHSICFECGRYGHKKEYCPEMIAMNTMPLKPKVDEYTPKTHEQVQATTGQGNLEGGNQMTENSTCFGPWMLAKKAPKRRTPKPNNQGKEETRKGSRYDVLHEESNTETRNQEESPMQGVEDTDEKSHKPQIHAAKQSKNSGKSQHSKTTPQVKKKPTGKQNKENVSPNPGILTSTAEQSQPNGNAISKQVTERKDWSQSMTKVQADLGDKFLDAASDSIETPSQILDTSEEELKLIQTFLQKKGLKELLLLLDIHDISQGDVHMLVDTKDPSS
ncbi:uncharacterized protein LOC130736485 [Lotus japonicus]|uniref:uncharacterized protein LOC130736485 n=1 Tax=Lotus japonicus TaxID=34305 RepID=UPI0025880D91|nr:uncharacterized protein LOC130736485 [Lotus japonicus]